MIIHSDRNHFYNAHHTRFIICKGVIALIHSSHKINFIPDFHNNSILKFHCIAILNKLYASYISKVTFNSIEAVGQQNILA